MSNDSEPDFGSVMILWLVLNGVLVLYALGLFIYAKYYRNTDNFKVILFIKKASDNISRESGENINIREDTIKNKTKVFDTKENDAKKGR